jgi:hypothetical protein
VVVAGGRETDVAESRQGIGIPNYGDDDYLMMVMMITLNGVLHRLGNLRTFAPVMPVGGGCRTAGLKTGRTSIHKKIWTTTPLHT